MANALRGGAGRDGEGEAPAVGLAATAGRIAAKWVYGGAVAAVVLLALTPIVAAAAPAAVVLVYLGLPVYMLHQLEEHDGDRFRRFFNAMLQPGRRGLTVADVFVINVIGVWAMFAAAILAAAFADPGWGLLVAYALLGNGIVHVAAGIALRKYNPGLVTAVVLFLPLGALQFAWLADATGAQHVVCLAIVVAVHAMIVAHARRPVEPVR